MSDTAAPRQLQAVLDVLGYDYASLFDADGGARRDKVVAWLYRLLDTLDSKTSHLVRLASLLLAAQTFLTGVLVRESATPTWVSMVVLVLLVLPLAAASFGFRVFHVNYRFFGKVHDGKSPQVGGIQEELRVLAATCDDRVDQHERAFQLCRVSVGAFALTLLFALWIFSPWSPRAGVDPHV